MSVEGRDPRTFGVSRHREQLLSSPPMPPVIAIPKQNGELFNLCGNSAMPPDFVHLLGMLTSPDGRRQILFIKGGGNRGIRNPNPWSGQDERIIFRHRGPGYGNPYVAPDAWAIHTFILPEQTLFEKDGILRELAEAKGAESQKMAA